MATYVSKATSAGQITIPKKVREALGLMEEDLVEFKHVGDAILIQKLKASQAKLDAIRAKVRRSGLTRERVEEIVEQACAKRHSGRRS